VSHIKGFGVVPISNYYKWFYIHILMEVGTTSSSSSIVPLLAKCEIFFRWAFEEVGSTSQAFHPFFNFLKHMPHKNDANFLGFIP